MLRFTTAGESHGRALVALMEGLPAGLPIAPEIIDRDLERRQWGYGRGGRMRIERDRAEIISGVRHGLTLGSPLALLIENKDWANWTDVMSPEALPDVDTETRRIRRPRPGHADLAGGQKFGARDLRNIAERASARETAARVACGSLAKQLLNHFGVEIRSHVVQLGSIPESPIEELSWEELSAIPEDAPLRCADEKVQQLMVALVDAKRKEGDTLGGVFEVVARGVIPGLGSHVSWSEKLDGRLAQAVMSIPAVKAVSIGAGESGSAMSGSRFHDEIFYADGKGFSRVTNRAGGLEGGITNGEEIRVRAHLKPISTLRRPLRSVDIDTKKEAPAAFERADITVVPAGGVIGEAMVALVLAQAMRDKFGGDNLGEMRRNFEGYQKELKGY